MDTAEKEWMYCGVRSLAPPDETLRPVGRRVESWLCQDDLQGEGQRATVPATTNPAISSPSIPFPRFPAL
jgi:hypothetical protein